MKNEAVFNLFLLFACDIDITFMSILVITQLYGLCMEIVWEQWMWWGIFFIHCYLQSIFLKCLLLSHYLIFEHSLMIAWVNCFAVVIIAIVQQNDNMLHLFHWKHLLKTATAVAQ